MDRNDRYWHYLETAVMLLAQQAADEAKRLHARTISTLGVSGSSGVPFFNAADEAIRRDIIQLLSDLTHDLREVAPGLYAWSQWGGPPALVRIGVDIPAPILTPDEAAA